jgi:hypothetical protein
MNDPRGFVQTRIKAKKIAICSQPLTVMTFSRNSIQTSKFLWPQQGVHQIHPERQRNETRNCVFHISSRLPLEPLASLDEHPGNYKEGDDQQAVDDIKHS